MAEHIRRLSDTDLRNLGSDELVREVQNDLGATELERDLARRLERAIYNNHYVCRECDVIQDD